MAYESDRWSPMARRLKWNIFSNTLTWYYLVFKFLQNEIWNFCWIFPTCGSEKVNLKKHYMKMVGGKTSGYRVYSQAGRAEELHPELPRNHSSMWSKWLQDRGKKTQKRSRRRNERDSPLKRSNSEASLNNTEIILSFAFSVSALVKQAQYITTIPRQL